MSDREGWRPLTPPRARTGGNAPFVSPFSRLARTHALSTAADAMVATALAGTIFFEGATSEARGKVLLYLILTMAPFALVSPLIGPALDRARSGRRWMIIGSALMRSALCLFMINDVDSLLLYPEAFAVLVLQKGYNVARSAVVPTTVRTDAELVEANSKLSLLSGLMGFVGAAPAALLFVIGPGWSLAAASLTFLAAGVVGLKLPRAAVADTPPDAAERAELRSVGLLLAASAMGLIRGIVGFLTLLLAFDFRKPDVPNWHFPVVAVISVLGSLIGAIISPRLRKAATEEHMLVGVLLCLVATGILSVLLGGFRGAAILGAAVGMGSVTGKLAFDSLVQRDAPDANRGRSFAKFETRFQVFWVVGAMLGLIAMPLQVGYVVVTLVAAFAAFSFGLGTLAWRHRSGNRSAATERAVEIEGHISRVQDAARRNVTRSVRSASRRVMGRVRPARSPSRGSRPSGAQGSGSRASGSGATASGLREPNVAVPPPRSRSRDGDAPPPPDPPPPDVGVPGARPGW